MFSHFCWDQTHTLNCYFLDSSTWCQVRLCYATLICLILKKVAGNMGFRCAVQFFGGSKLKNTVTKFKSFLNSGVHNHNKTILQPTKYNFYKKYIIPKKWNQFMNAFTQKNIMLQEI